MTEGSGLQYENAIYELSVYTTFPRMQKVDDGSVILHWQSYLSRL